MVYLSCPINGCYKEYMQQWRWPAHFEKDHPEEDIHDYIDYVEKNTGTFWDEVRGKFYVDPPAIPYSQILRMKEEQAKQQQQIQKQAQLEKQMKKKLQKEQQEQRLREKEEEIKLLKSQIQQIQEQHKSEIQSMKNSIVQIQQENSQIKEQNLQLSKFQQQPKLDSNQKKQVLLEIQKILDINKNDLKDKFEKKQYTDEQIAKFNQYYQDLQQKYENQGQTFAQFHQDIFLKIKNSYLGDKRMNFEKDEKGTQKIQSDSLLQSAHKFEDNEKNKTCQPIQYKDKEYINYDNQQNIQKTKPKGNIDENLDQIYTQETKDTYDN